MLVVNQVNNMAKINKELIAVSILALLLCFGAVSACHDPQKPTTPPTCDNPVDIDISADNDAKAVAGATSESDANVINSGNSLNNNDNDATVKDSGNSKNDNVNVNNNYVQNTILVSQYVKQTNKQKSAQMNFQSQMNYQEQYNEQNPEISNDAGLVVYNGQTYCMDQNGRLCPCTVSEDGILVVKAQTENNETAMPMETTGGPLLPLLGGIALGGVGIVGAMKQGWIGF